MTLKEFLDQKTIRNAWVKHPEFAALYVRQGPFIYFFKGELRDQTRRVENSIQLAALTAKKPGNGAFGRLISWLDENYSNRVILVECVHEERFGLHLLKMGFRELRTEACYVKEPVYSNLIRVE